MENNKYLSRDKTQALIDELKVKQADGKAFLDGLAKKGYTIEGFNDQPKPNIAQTVAGGLVKAPTDLIGTGFAGVGALGQRIGETGTKYVAGKLDQFINATGGFDGEQTFSERVAGQQPSTIGQAYQNQSQQVQESGANTILQPLTGEKIRPAQNLKQLGGDVLQTGALAIPGATLGKGATTLAKVGAGLGYGAVTGGAAGAGMAMSDDATLEDILKQGGIGAGLGGALGAAIPLVPAAIGLVKKAPDAYQSAKSLRSNLQAYIGSKNVQPTFGTAATRLTGTASRLETPLMTYEKYYPLAQKAISDTKVDAPISMVGEGIGDAFNKVVANRRAVGNVMGQELKTVGKLKTNIEPIFTQFETALDDAGLTYNGLSKKIMSSDLAKVAPDDIAVIEDFVGELNRIGSNPSISQIDALISRMNDKITFANSAKGLTSTTNGQRLVKATLSSLRNTFDNIPELAKYSQARKSYAELSNFIDEGAGFLGKVTQSGDFAKDASIAKSAVQSILNNGKKDWLLKLEALTDYPALDEATLALQAMKDAGDFRGLSLLETLSDGAIPTSKAGFTQKLIDYLAEKGVKTVAGSPAERTMAYLKSLEGKSLNKTVPTNIKINTAIPASGLKTRPTTKAINKSSNIIDNTIPQKVKGASKTVDKSKN